jgi:hypothetical protein
MNKPIDFNTHKSPHNSWELYFETRTWWELFSAMLMLLQVLKVPMIYTVRDDNSSGVLIIGFGFDAML